MNFDEMLIETCRDEMIIETCLGVKIDLVEEALKNGADVDAKDEYTSRTALHYASRIGNLEIVKTLLEHGADATIKDKYGRTSLYYALDNGYLEIVKMIIENM